VINTKQVTVKLPEYQLQELDETVKTHGYPSRAEFIREAVRDKLAQVRMKPQLPQMRRG
jgi:metal-responsive CopG/Arc/MetJ family transcriptional regulator